MMMVRKILLAPLSLLYIAVVAFRHWLFDRGIVGSERFSTPTICVGNITVGGSGKSPMGELLLSHLSQHYAVAILSRGYGRSTKGYRVVEVADSYLDVGDEPLQIKRKFPSALVVVCERRALAIRRIEMEQPQIDVIVMDDGFQHRHVSPHCNIIMVDATRPTFEDMPLPAGELRDTISSLKRADIFVVTKCPSDMSDQRRGRFCRELLSSPSQSIYFTQIVNREPRPIFADAAAAFDPSAEVIALSGIGNPAPFVETLRSRHKLREVITYPDHHSYTQSEIQALAQRLVAAPEARIITTEKDAVKFLSNSDIPPIVRERTYYSPIEMKFVVGDKLELLKRIENYVTES
ncbi:MAG: tetraacyldisaccharide 4'-kinase [Rikenellaceae bacterium]